MARSLVYEHFPNKDDKTETKVLSSCLCLFKVIIHLHLG